MRLRLDAGQRILLICVKIRAKRLNSGHFRPNFRAESPASARINILWLWTQSNKPSWQFFLLPDNREIFVEVLKAVGIFIAGGFGGYGLHAYSSESRERKS